MTHPDNSFQRPDSTRGYAENADVLAAQYESITFTDVYRDVLHLVPTKPCRIIDIGAGTGRDAAALARLGHQVIAVEPTSELRSHGKRLHRTTAVEWVDDSLPELPRIRSRNERYDLILLTAVWMHLDRSERHVAMGSLRDLVAETGTILMSLRRGPVPPGRRMFDVSCDETGDLAGQHGMRIVHRSEREDMLGRGDVWWSFLALSPFS